MLKASLSTAVAKGMGALLCVHSHVHSYAQATSSCTAAGGLYVIASTIVVYPSWYLFLIGLCDINSGISSPIRLLTGLHLGAIVDLRYCHL